MDDALSLRKHNVVAVLADPGAAPPAVRRLVASGIERSHVSVLVRQPGETGPLADDFEEPKEVTDEMLRGAAKDGAAGAAVGGLAGFIAGLLVFAIPGVGPVLGAGVWAATAAGAAAGSVAGGLIGGFGDMWSMRYCDLVRDGAALVAVHTDDWGELAQASRLLSELHPLHLDEFDRDGNLIHESS